MCGKNKQTDQWNRLESQQEMDPYKHSQLSLVKQQKPYNEVNIVSSMNGAGKNGHPLEKNKCRHRP